MRTFLYMIGVSLMAFFEVVFRRILKKFNRDPLLKVAEIFEVSLSWELQFKFFENLIN